ERGLRLAFGAPNVYRLLPARDDVKLALRTDVEAAVLFTGRVRLEAPEQLAVEADDPDRAAGPGEQEVLALLAHAQPDVAALRLTAELLQGNRRGELVGRRHLEDPQPMLIDGVEAARLARADVGGSVPLHRVADQEIRHVPQ